MNSHERLMGENNNETKQSPSPNKQSSRKTTYPELTPEQQAALQHQNARLLVKAREALQGSYDADAENNDRIVLGETLEETADEIIRDEREKARKLKLEQGVDVNKVAEEYLKTIGKNITDSEKDLVIPAEIKPAEKGTLGKILKFIGGK